MVPASKPQRMQVVGFSASSLTVLAATGEMGGASSGRAAEAFLGVEGGFLGEEGGFLVTETLRGLLAGDASALVKGAARLVVEVLRVRAGARAGRAAGAFVPVAGQSPRRAGLTVMGGGTWGKPPYVRTGVLGSDMGSPAA